jgi:hypothetical protein
MGQSKDKLPVLEIGLDILTRTAAAHLDLTKPPDLGNLLKGINNKTVRRYEISVYIFSVFTKTQLNGSKMQ